MYTHTYTKTHNFRCFLSGSVMLEWWCSMVGCKCKNISKTNRWMPPKTQNTKKNRKGRSLKGVWSHFCFGSHFWFYGQILRFCSFFYFIVIYLICFYFVSLSVACFDCRVFGLWPCVFVLFRCQFLFLLSCFCLVVSFWLFFCFLFFCFFVPPTVFLWFCGHTFDLFMRCAALMDHCNLFPRQRWIRKQNNTCSLTGSSFNKTENL